MADNFWDWLNTPVNLESNYGKSKDPVQNAVSVPAARIEKERKKSAKRSNEKIGVNAPNSARAKYLKEKNATKEGKLTPAELYARNAAQARDRKSMQPVAPEEPTPPSYLDQLLSDLDANWKSSDGGYGQLIAGAQARAPQDRARLEALYKQYADMIAGQEADINRNFDTSAQSYRDIYGSQAAQTKAIYDASRAAATQQLQALGLTQAAPPGIAGQQASAESDIQRIMASRLSDVTAGRQLAQTTNQLNTQAATREGVGAVQSYDRRIADLLMQMQAKQAAAQAESANQYATLRQNAITNAKEMTQAEAEAQLNAEIQAAKLAASAKPTVDFQSVYAGILAANPNMDPDTAMTLAQNQAKYM